jgi:DNA polymerase-3 subunit alpha
MRFCHLHLHTEYSLLDGLGTAAEYAARAKEMGFEYLGCTDHGSLDGLIKFQRACHENEITPIFGCEAYLVPNRYKKEKEIRRHITIWIENEDGWNSLCYMLSKAHTEGFYKRPRIDSGLLMEHIKNRTGLVFGSACAGSFLRNEDLQNLAWEMKDHNTPLYLEIMPHDIPAQNSLNKTIEEFQGNFPLVITNDCHYAHKEDWESQEVLLAIQTRRKWDDPDRFRFGFTGLHLRSYEEMQEAFDRQGFWTNREIVTGARNSMRIAKQCSGFTLAQKKSRLPSPPMSQHNPNKAEGPGADQKELESLAQEGLERLPIPEFAMDEYGSRLRHELSIIEEKGFSRYFLIVLDLILWCRKSGIWVGPGRGSVGGSLVAYCLGITKVDPIKHNLVFERFISADRNDWPDIDIDIEDRKRGAVKQYLESAYGKDCVAGISTFGRMKGKAVIRDVARVFDRELDIQFSEIDEFAKGIKYEDENKGMVVLTHAQGEGKFFADKFPKVIFHSAMLEGKARHASQHAAAVVISPEPIQNSGRGHLCKRREEILVNWDMEDAEYMGLIKLDLLGLNTLSILSETLQLIEKNRGDGFYYHPESCSYFFDFEDSDESVYLSPAGQALDHITLDDQKVFDALSAGETTGIFQWGTYAMTSLAKKLQPRNFADMVAAIALVRPGPADSGVADQYIERRHGSGWNGHGEIYEYDRITYDTFGLIVYQEQVMQFLHRLAGMTLSEADKIRKILAKKQDPAKLEPYRKKFLEGAEELELITLGQATRFWEDLKNHAHYSFNRAHSVEYALIGYWTAWLKVNYPQEFICAALTCGKESQKEELLEEASRLGLQIIPPKIGLSDPFKWEVNGGQLVCPFIEIKGVGEKTAGQCSLQAPKSKKTGFLKGQKGGGSQPLKNKKLNQIMENIGAYDRSLVDLPSEALSYFDFKFPGGHIAEQQLVRIRRSLPEAKRCDKCELYNQCRRPIPLHPGIYNAMVLGEAPGRVEDKSGKAFIGPAGNLVWKEIAPYGWERRHFHISNTCKCYPGQIKTPKAEHIEACFTWLKQEVELLESPIILSFGNIPLQALTGEKGGITKRSGKTEYLPALKAWVCWCVHPSSVLRNEKANRPLFQAGIENFIRTIDFAKGEKF